MALTYREGREGNQHRRSIPSRAKLAHLYSRIFNVPLMIHPAKLQVILQDLGARFMEADHLESALAAIDIPASLQPLGQINLRSNTDRKAYAVTETGIAIIPIDGALVKKSSWMGAMSGMCSYEDIASQFADAINDASIKAVLFDIDSPGGETHGAFELSDLIYQARGSKPIYAAANDLAASAAYAIASAADRIYTTITGAVGSIGVYCLHFDQASLDTKLGIKYTYIYAGENKVDGNPHEPLSKSAHSTTQTEIDRQYGLFISAVGRNRDLSAADVKATKALCYFADNAVPMLADAVGTLEDAVADLEKQLKISGISSVQTLANTTNATAVVVPAIASAPAPQSNVQGDTTPMLTKAQLAAQIKEQEDNLKKLKAQVAAANGDSAPVTDPEDPATTAAVDPCEDDDTKMARIAASAAVAAVRSNRTARQVATAVPVTAPNAAPAATAAPAAPVTDDSFAIAELCIAAGRPELTAKFLIEKKSYTAVRTELAAMRSAASNANPTDPYHNSGNPGGGDALDKFEQAAATLMANSGGKLTKAQAYEAVMKSQPALYTQYEEERDRSFTNKSTRTAYTASCRQKFAAIGLGMGL